MHTAIIRGIIYRSITILSIFILLSGCHHSSGGNSQASSENANQTNLTLSYGTLSPVFDVNTYSYTAQVANNVSSITATMTTAESGSTITVNGKAVSSGAASQSINLLVGLNTIKIVVTNGTTTQTYTVAVTRLAAGASVSNNSNLAGLSLSTGIALSPVFSTSTTSYTAQVANNVSSITATPTAADSASTIIVNGQAVSSGAVSQSINLAVGTGNTITIVVTAQDKTTTQTYTVAVTRLAAGASVSNNSNLAGLSLSLGSILLPAFALNATSYTAQVPDNISSIAITPTAASSTSTITVNGKAVSSGAASTINISSVNTITIVVTAQDGTTTKYTVSIARINAFMWVSGGYTNTNPIQRGIYGANIGTVGLPGGRDSSVSWIDSSNNLWLFGGYGYDSTGNEGYLNDLWKFDGTNWTWVSGSNTYNQRGIYGANIGTVGVPGGRDSSVSWIDSSNNLWLFGGYGYDSAGNGGYLNDLWEFDGTNWTWVSGNNTNNTSKQYGVYGIIGVASGGVPGGRYSSVSWIDKSGNFWLFGGKGYDIAGNDGDLNDLWKFDGTNWTWVSGSNRDNQSGSYGTKKGTVGVPGGRYSSVSWIDKSGNLWLFGGYGYDAGIVPGDLNDLWKFNGTNWIWVSGDNTKNQNGVYSGAASANKPGARYASVSWIDSSGLLWLFGGDGYDSAGNEGYLNDLWEFDGTNWTWVSGGNTNTTYNQHGYYDYGDAARVPLNTFLNIPGSRAYSVSWIDSSNNLWFFGGYGYDINGSRGFLNDLWQYK